MICVVAGSVLLFKALHFLHYDCDAGIYHQLKGVYAAPLKEGAQNQPGSHQLFSSLWPPGPPPALASSQPRTFAVLLLENVCLDQHRATFSLELNVRSPYWWCWNVQHPFIKLLCCCKEGMLLQERNEVSAPRGNYLLNWLHGLLNFHTVFSSRVHCGSVPYLHPSNANDHKKEKEWLTFFSLGSIKWC